MIVLSSALPKEFPFNQGWLDLPGVTSDKTLENQTQMRKSSKRAVSYGGTQLLSFLPTSNSKVESTGIKRLHVRMGR